MSTTSVYKITICVKYAKDPFGLKGSNILRLLAAVLAVVLLLEQFRIVRNSILIVIVFDSGFYCLLSQHRAVDLMSRKPVKSFNNCLVCKLPSLLIFRKIFMMSPHFAFPTSPTPSAFSIVPTLRGCVK